MIMMTLIMLDVLQGYDVVHDHTHDVTRCGTAKMVL
jgi:hypothetical protein